MRPNQHLVGVAGDVAHPSIELTRITFMFFSLTRAANG